MIQFTKQQNQALEAISKWYSNLTKSTFTLGGYAGTGKTSLIPTIRDILGCNSAVVTYTNKAASVLRDKGETDATTIFKLMYKLIDEQNMVWRKEDKVDVDNIIVDEASMVSQKIRDDLESFGIPVLYIGDPFQLPPVKEESVMEHCDFTLTEVMRHGDAILDIATAIREGRPYEDVDQYSLSDEQLASADMVICLSNQRRYLLNQRIRKHQSKSVLPQAGDRVVAAKTDYDNGIFAGEFGTLVSTNNKRRYEVLFDGNYDTTVFTNGYFLQQNDNPYSQDLRGRSCLDFGYVSTAHKCQGSQFDKVIVWEESRADARWKYTAATRAVKELIMAGV